jgi:antitoxin (DNA-binding transcriptional repressor) of toxin-antitoxin stability system
MKTATLRDLRYDFKKIENWLKAGEDIEITRHSKPIARLSPPKKTKKKLVHPDYEARAKRIFGDRVFTEAEVEEMRAFETGEP